MSARIRMVLTPVHAACCGGQEVVDLHADTVVEAIDELTRRFPKLEKLLRDSLGETINVYLNRVIVRPADGENPHLHDGDEIIVLSALSGG